MPLLPGYSILAVFPTGQLSIIGIKRITLETGVTQRTNSSLLRDYSLTHYRSFTKIVVARSCIVIESRLNYRLESSLCYFEIIHWCTLVSPVSLHKNTCTLASIIKLITRCALIIELVLSRQDYSSRCTFVHLMIFIHFYLSEIFLKIYCTINYSW